MRRARDAVAHDALGGAGIAAVRDVTGGRAPGPADHPQWLDPFRPAGDTRAPSYGTSGRLPSFLFEPLRLDLLAPLVPRPNAEGSCSSAFAAGAATAATPGFAPQQASAIRLVPSLTLYGFSRSGCGADGAVGGGLVYATRVTPKTWLVGSAGAIFVPRETGGPPRSARTPP